VLTHSYDLSDERTLSGRMVMRDGNTNFYLAYRQRVRKGTDVLIVVGDPNADEWVSRLAVKAMWCYCRQPQMNTDGHGWGRARQRPPLRVGRRQARALRADGTVRVSKCI
jgi:hypothetical protein